MDYTITWGGDPEDVCMTPSGIARLRDLNAMLRAAVADPRWVDGMKVLLDYTRVDMSALSSVEMELRARQITGLAEAIGRQRLAVVVGKRPDNYQAVRMIGFRLDGQVGFVGRVFTTLEEARQWLREPGDQGHGHVGPRPQGAA